MHSVSGSMSTSTGVAPTCSITFTHAANVYVDVMTSAPGPIPSAASARCNAPVAEFTASPCCAPASAATRRASSCARGPVVIQPDSSVSMTRRFSASPIHGTASGRKRARTGVPPAEASFSEASSVTIARSEWLGTRS